MPKINVYLPGALADAVRDAQVPVSAICQAALERAVRDVTAARATDGPPADDSSTGLFARFTPRARQAVTLAQEAARAVPHNYMGTEHLLLGVLDEGGNVALRVLAALEIDLDDLRAELAGSMPGPTTRVEGHLPFTPRVKTALELAAKEAMSLGHNYVGCEHLLLGLLGVDAIASKVLRRMGLELRTTRMAVTRTLVELFTGYQPAAPAPPTSTDDVLARILERLEAIERRLAS